MSTKPQLSSQSDLAEAINSDFATAIVPINHRRPWLTLGLLWLAMQTAFPNLYIGFTAQRQGQPLADLIIGCTLGITLLSVYGVFAGLLGARTGQTHPVLTRNVFGQAGSVIVSILLMIMGMGWYGFQAQYLAQLILGLYNWPVSLVALALLFGVVMSINNFFGFSGVTAFARYLAAPVLFLWALYALIKGFDTNSGAVLFAHPQLELKTSMLATASLIIGVAAWGNEPDFWRFSTVNGRAVAGPMLIANAIGLIVFPVAGWIMGLLANTDDLGKAVHFITEYSLFGNFILAGAILFVSQVAVNDSNLYEAVNAMQNIFRWKRYYSVLMLAVIGTILSWKMSQGSTQDAFFIVAGIGATFVPCATTIMIADLFLVPQLFGISRDFSRVPSWRQAAFANWAAIVALLLGCVTGVVFSIPGNIIPGFGLSVGIAPAEAWAVSFLSYLVFVSVVHKLPKARQILGFPGQ